MISSIRKIRSRDIQGLADTFSHVDDDYFEMMYLEHIQETQMSFIAVNKHEDEIRYLGYASIAWESNYTQFWRRNIPEITDVYVHESHRRRGFGKMLITACEVAAKHAKHNNIGISVTQSDEFLAAQALYEKLGYQADGFGISTDNNQLHLLKVLE